MPPHALNRNLNRTQAGGLQTTARWLLALYVLDRALKLLAVDRFLRRPLAPGPAPWPPVTLLQPITRGASNLPGALACRAALRYAGPLQHLLICDAADGVTIAACTDWRAAHPHLDVAIIVATTSLGEVATKVEKLQAALPVADGEILAFVDDDILLRPDALDRLVRHLQDEHAGAAFGLAAYTNWSNIPTSLLSAFVNANALLSYLPLTYLAEPYTITGHFYALRREVFAAIGGLAGMEGRFDDDHELARRVQQYGLANVQTSVIYDVDNYLCSIDGYTNQMQRWFAIPRQTMAPYLSPYQQFVSLLGSAGNLIPPLLALLTLLGRLTPLTPFRRPACHTHPCRPARISFVPLASVLALFGAVYAWCEHAYLGRRTPLRRWPWVLLSALIAPLQALGGLLGGDTFTWRGRRLRLHRGGRFETVPGSDLPEGGLPGGGLW